MELHPIAELVDPLMPLGAGAANESMHLHAALEQEASQVGPVLSGDAGDQCAGMHAGSFGLRAVGRWLNERFYPAIG